MAELLILLPHQPVQAKRGLGDSECLRQKREECLHR